MTDISSMVPIASRGGNVSIPAISGPASQSPVTAKHSEAEEAGIRKAAKDFEAVFLRQMIGSMRSASLGEDLLGNDAGNQFRDLADARLADDMAEQQSFGIANMLLKQFGVDGPQQPPKPQSGE
jgi:flagellar protein FlgJ